jgi:hypothetical protein
LGDSDGGKPNQEKGCAHPENLSVQNKRASRYCDAPLPHWPGSPSIHGALP